MYVFILFIRIVYFPLHVTQICRTKPEKCKFHYDITKSNFTFKRNRKKVIILAVIGEITIKLT